MPITMYVYCKFYIIKLPIGYHMIFIYERQTTDIVLWKVSRKMVTYIPAGYSDCNPFTTLTRKNKKYKTSHPPALCEFAHERPQHFLAFPQPIPLYFTRHFRLPAAVDPIILLCSALFFAPDITLHFVYYLSISFTPIHPTRFHRCLPK